jgi:hypothetical protein
MKNNNVIRAVARATGETTREIARRGFSLLDLSRKTFDHDADVRLPVILDWDLIQSQQREYYGAQ